MAEVHQVPEFGSMGGSTGHRKKYKKLALLGAAARANLASAVLAPLLALGAVGLITLAAVENSTNALPESPAQYGWQDGGGQSQGNPPANAPDNPKPPEPPKEPEKPKPPEKKPEVSSPPSLPPTDPPPTDPPPTDPPPTDPPPPSSPAAPVYYNDDSGDDDSGGPSTTDPSATGKGGSCELESDFATITGNYHLDLGSATGARITGDIYLDDALYSGSVFWNPDDPAYTASGDYSIRANCGAGDVEAAKSLSMVLTITFEPDGTTQTVNIPITIPRPPFTAPTLSFSGGVISRDGLDMTYYFNYSVDTKSASQVTVVATLTLDDSAHTTETRQFTHDEPNNVSGATIRATYTYPADYTDHPTEPPSFNATLTLYASYEEYGEARVLYPTPDTITYTYSG